CMQDIRFPLTF
nr:immunoglobulin light chain junction region [Macaca mulatta]MOW43394.1 immunoglobulin light chain junction region [Macaca mulatta]